jgi:hypothetical protein
VIFPAKQCSGNINSLICDKLKMCWVQAAHFCIKVPVDHDIYTTHVLIPLNLHLGKFCEDKIAGNMHRLMCTPQLQGYRDHRHPASSPTEPFRWSCAIFPCLLQQPLPILSPPVSNHCMFVCDCSNPFSYASWGTHSGPSLVLPFPHQTHPHTELVFGVSEGSQSWPQKGTCTIALNQHPFQAGPCLLSIFYM